MSTDRIAGAALKRSRTAERLALVGGQQETSIARIEVAETDSREWRVTLGRTDPGNGRPPLVSPSTVTAFSALIRSNLYGYSAGRLVTPSDPPRRDNPCSPPNGSDVDPLFVELAWGQAGGSVSRLLAHWPAQGASIVVVGSFVEVFAGSFLLGVAAADLPLLQAAIAPADGLSTNDSGELSLQQLVPLSVATPLLAVVGVPEFARRVRVVAIDSTAGSGGGRIPATGDPRVIGEWFDDQGNICDTWIQGSAIGAPASWQTVPARAVLLRMINLGASFSCGETYGDTLTARVHWRVAP